MNKKTKGETFIIDPGAVVREVADEKLLRLSIS